MMQLPHVPLPKVSIPKVSIPKVSLPHVPVPHIPIPHGSANPSGGRTLDEAIGQIAASDRLLIALDFDGTLAPFVDTPQAARAIPAAQAAIARLETIPDTWIAYVSGRPLSSLARVTEADDDTLLVGSHGVEIKLGSDGEQLDLTPEESRQLAALGEALDEIVTKNPDVRLERKPVGFGVHTRLLPADDAKAVNDKASAVAQAISSELTVRDGKDILEFSVRTANKGDGLARLAEHVHATATFFAGDDVTDEDGFAVLQATDVGVKVGSGDTAADYRVADPATLAALLDALADARAGRSS